MTLPRSHAPAGRSSHVPRAGQPDAWHKTEGKPIVNRAAGPAAPPLAGDSGRGVDAGQGTDAGRGVDSGRDADAGRPPAERVWEQRRALGRRLASLRSRAGFSQWEFAPLTGYSRSTLSDAELGRHRLRREFWQRCDEALTADGVLTAAYDRIEVVATAVRRTARSQAEAVREEQALRRLQALLPAPRAEVLGADGAGAAADGAGAGSPAFFGVAAVGPAAVGPAPGGPAPVGRDGFGAATNGVVWGSAGPETATQSLDEAAQAAPAVMEQCPHCHQPVTVIIVPAAPPTAGGSAG
jgi:transcriptional regulator with XRE-family HTH domain